MQASAPERKETPTFTTPDASMDEQQAASPSSPDSAEPINGTIDPLVAKATKSIADVINDFKRELHHRDGVWAHAQGCLELALNAGQPSVTFKLTIVPNERGDECPVTVQATSRKPGVVTSDNDTAPTARPLLKPMHSESALERDLVPHKKRRLVHGDAVTNKRPRTSETEEEDKFPLITKNDVDNLLTKLREDIQDDTTETVNHVQRLLRRFKEGLHDKTKWDSKQPRTQQSGVPFCDSSAASAGPGGSFPSPEVEGDDVNSSVVDVVRREAGLLSRQIKWVEDCRRVANDVHVKREDTWRTSSAGFHDQQRLARESFQNRMVHESSMHSQMLTQILNEVKAIGLYAQNMKWETPSYLNHVPNVSPQVPTPPTFPTQPAPSTNSIQPTQTMRDTSSESKQPNQRQHFTWKTGHGPGTQNG